MTNLTAISSADPIPELETTTMALGGSGGPMNTQAQALLNNLQYLKDNQNTSTYNVISATSYSPVLTDSGITIVSTSGTAVTINIETNATTPFPIGTNIDIIQAGAGKITIAPRAGVTVNSLNGFLIVSGQNGVVTLRKYTSDVWFLFGSLSPI